MYIIKGLLNIIAGILICFVKSPFDNEVLNICVSLYQWYSTVFENIQVKAPKMVLLHFHPIIF